MIHIQLRATPMPWCGLSPSELSMGRRIRTTVPQTTKQLIPNWSYIPQFKNDNRQFKRNQKVDIDKRHRVREQSSIPEGSRVVVTTDHQLIDGKVVEYAQSPRSYIVATPSGNIRRNHSQLNVVPEQPAASESTTDSGPVVNSENTDTRVEPNKIVTRSQTRTPVPHQLSQGGDVVISISVFCGHISTSCCGYIVHTYELLVFSLSQLLSSVQFSVE